MAAGQGVEFLPAHGGTPGLVLNRGGYAAIGLHGHGLFAAAGGREPLRHAGFLDQKFPRLLGGLGGCRVGLVLGVSPGFGTQGTLGLGALTLGCGVGFLLRGRPAHAAAVRPARAFGHAALVAEGHTAVAVDRADDLVIRAD